MNDVLNILSLICAGLSVYVVYKILKDVLNSSDKILNVFKRKIERKNIFLKYFAHTSRWLKNMGVSYMFKKDVSVYSFIMIRIICSIIFFIIGSTYLNNLKSILNDVVLALFVFAGSYVPQIIIKMSNSMDNDMMLDDIKIMYDTLKIQSKAGVYIADILTECYMLVRMKRLKTALMELSNNIYTKHDLNTALNDFNSKFKNIYIDMLVMTIEQSLESGQTIQMFNDIAQQIQQVEYALYEKEKRRAENKMLAYQLAVYFGILIVVVYAMFSQLFKAFVF